MTDNANEKTTKPLLEIFGDAAVTLNGVRIETRPDGGFTARKPDGEIIADYSPRDEAAPFSILWFSEETAPPPARPAEYQSDSGNEENISWPLGGPRPPVA